MLANRYSSLLPIATAESFVDVGKDLQSTKTLMNKTCIMMMMTQKKTEDLDAVHESFECPTS